MKLKPGERSILASFDAGGKAEAAEQELRQAGFGELGLDRIAETRFDPAADQRRPGRGARTQTGLVLYDQEGNLDGEERVLLGATPAVSGLSDEAELIAPFLLTVLTSEERVDEALRIIRKHGGRA